MCVCVQRGTVFFVKGHVPLNEYQTHTTYECQYVCAYELRLNKEWYFTYMFQCIVFPFACGDVWALLILPAHSAPLLNDVFVWMAHRAYRRNPYGTPVVGHLLCAQSDNPCRRNFGASCMYIPPTDHTIKTAVMYIDRIYTNIQYMYIVNIWLRLCALWTRYAIWRRASSTVLVVESLHKPGWLGSLGAHIREKCIPRNGRSRYGRGE